MIELKERYGRGTFHFHNIEECEAFLYVFRDHWCNVEWRPPAHMQDNSQVEDIEYMNIPPKQRALSNLSWGFNIAKDLTVDQERSVLLMQNDFLK